MLSQQREKLIYLIYNKGIALKKLYLYILTTHTNEKTNYRRFRLFCIYMKSDLTPFDPQEAFLGRQAGRFRQETKTWWRNTEEI